MLYHTQQSQIPCSIIQRCVYLRSKEYILVRKQTAPPCVFQTLAHPTSPCSVCSILQLPDCLTEQAGGEVGWANVWKTQEGAVRSLTNIYSLVAPVQFPVYTSAAKSRHSLASSCLTSVAGSIPWLMSRQKKLIFTHIRVTCFRSSLMTRRKADQREMNFRVPSFGPVLVSESLSGKSTFLK